MNTKNICPECGKAVTQEGLQGLCPECMIKVGVAPRTAEFGPEGTQLVQPSSAPVPSAEELGRLFPQFEILECLGRGGMGVVYKARQPKLDRFVALKILLPERRGGGQFGERFAREARALARLSHPDIVAVHDFGEAGGYPYLVMEYVDGLSLRQLLQRGKLAPEEALVIVPKICAALQFAHQQGVVHRDIKPENILLDKQGQVKIADFGIAKIVAPGVQDLSLTGGKDVVGTPHYMAPEQLEQPTKVDHRADIFSLGVVFYEMLTGELPLGNFQPPSRKVQVDVRLDEVVLHALEKEPGRRYQHASQVSAPPPVEAAPRPSQPDLWKRLQARFWPPLVGRRQEQRVINWPAVAMRGLRGGLAAFMGGTVGGFSFGMTTHPSRGLGFGLGVFLVGCMTVCFILTIRILRGFACPLEMLRELDSLPQPAGEPATGASSAPPVEEASSKLPGAMWFAVIILGLMVLGKLVAVPFVGAKALISAGLSAVLLAGLVMRARWAYVLVIAGSAYGVFHTAAQGALPAGFHSTVFQAQVERLLMALLTLLLDALVFVPVLLSTSWFFPADYPEDKRRRWLWGTAGATTLAILAGLFYSVGQPTAGLAGLSEAAGPAPLRSSSYLARLPQGEIELLAVSCHPSDNQPWWRPDGSPWQGEPLALQRSHTKVEADQIGREFVIRLTGLPAEASEPFWQLHPFGGWAAGEVGQLGQPMRDLRGISASLPKSARTVTLKVGVAMGAWETVAQTEPHRSGRSEVRRQAQKWTVSCLQSEEVNGSACIAVNHTVKEWEVRVVAVDTNGTVHATAGSQLNCTDGVAGTTASFAGLPLAQVKEFRFQVRPCHWVEFRNVVLNPAT
ncbi:MAG: serine/threonine-protein kinase [Verrucomicrobia bacterium]|nr:serine/threonine-protein kinase [Verrucomicrobiota bacterium]